MTTRKTKKRTKTKRKTRSARKSKPRSTRRASTRTASSKKKSATKSKARAKKPAGKPVKRKTSNRRASSKTSTRASAATRKPKSQEAKPREITQEEDRRRRKALKTKPLSRKFLAELAQAIKEAVGPTLAAGKGREIVGQSQSNDATFELDRIAEKALLAFLRRSGLPVAYYSEDSGYSTFSSGQPENLLVVDPIDGTRAAKNGFEACVVSVCSTRIIERPTIADVDNAYVLDLIGNRAFFAERGKGAKMYLDGRPRKIRLSENDDLESVAWSMTVPARPAELIFPTAALLIDLTSLKGGFFACNSSSFSLTRLVSGQLDACIDIANRFYRDIPNLVADDFVNAGRGDILGMCPYDFAAGLLIAEEAGCVVTDAYGERFEHVLLLDSSVGNHQSLIAAANPDLHEALLAYFDTRIRQTERVRELRAEHANGR